MIRQSLSFYIVGLVLLSPLSTAPGNTQVCETYVPPIDSAYQLAPIMTKREAKGHHDRAVKLANEGNLDAAIDEDRQAMNGNPDHAGYRILMARLLTERGQLQSALDIYEDVYQRFPSTREDIGELVMGLRSTISFLKVDQALSRANSSAPTTSQTKPEDINTVADERTHDVVPSDKSRRRKMGAMHTVINRLMSSGSPIDDPIY